MSKIDKSQVDSTILTEDDPAGASILDDLSDVTISSPVKGDILVFQGSPAIWTPGSVAPVAVRKSVNEDVVSSTVLQNDDELVVTLPVAGTWMIDWFLLIRDLAVGAGYKQDFDTTSIASPAWYTHQSNTSSSNTDLPQTGIDLVSEDVVLPVATGAGTGLYDFRMVVRATIAGAIVQLRWAQNVSDVTATRVEAGSSVLAQYIA